MHRGSACGQREGRGECSREGAPQHQHGQHGWSQGRGERGGGSPGTDRGSRSRQAVQAIVRTLIFFSRERNPREGFEEGCGLCLLGSL